MITITNKKQYPSEQYLNELITNIEFAARAPVEVVRAMAAELQKRREADSAEPVAYIFKHPAGKLFWALTDESNKEQADVIPVYAAPPVPVVPEEKPMPNPLKMYAVDAVAAIAEVRGWNACRAAMLQAEPVSNSDELPLDYLQGHKDGLEWAAQLAEANHPQTGDWLYDDPIDLARAIRKGPDMPTVQAGNYPVTPDGWISCSERMPAQDDWILIYSKHGEYMAGQVQGEYVELSDGTLSWLGNALYWMPLPEPPQEVN
ncbi:DUF551 domain-containing protein [Escherichia coli]|uniref:DUF551 domain-containing protein n=4 Tax=Escherichia coli TaxID=562 RepID=UPI0003BAE1AB|nr:DUF551 domain-containing protein [Escherichia coli]EFL9766862.1 DUF551 domain-containing protein [Escherichia coli]ESD39438.1 hypothetical protein HMPREF1604_03123 [Escherichia coli 908519]MBH9613246.1 DUF551 domain-containing protein [Escherichia coli]MCE2360078.1 DUF551 domain-containing protein [Escherichia coli]MCN4772113.1 DUF551 domain-containing protein [Escherichia coli]